MTTYKKTIDAGVHSRLKNDLLENQKWWPVTLKYAGDSGHLTIDPVLYRSEINDADELKLAQAQAQADESKYAGVRVEYLLTNATKSALGSAEGTCTVEIQNSGTWSAQAVVTWPDSSTSTIPLIAESHDGKWSSSDRHQPLASRTLSATRTVGPSPVPMTLQEFADILDTFTKRDGAYAAETPSGRTWLPHPNEQEYTPHASGGGTTNALVDYSQMPLITNWLGAEANAQIAATIFMPMCMNVNQFSRNMVASTATTISEYQDAPDGSPPATNEVLPATDGKGITRFDPDPEGADAATVQYGFANQSGDHRFGKRRYGNLDDDSLGYVDGADSTLAPNPKWRMRMCLAMFLKDGTYTISGGGALIPYVYDSTREVGGEHHRRTRGQHAAEGTYLRGDGLYATWQPASRSSETPTAMTHASAMISPGLDFVQGPLSNPAHGFNIDIESVWGSIYGNLMEGGHAISGTTVNHQEYIHSVNPLPVPVYGIALASNTLSIYVDSAECQAASPIGVGDALYITGIEGLLGWDSDDDCNGYWVIAARTIGADSDSPSGQGVKYDCTCNVYSSTVTKYVPTGAVVCQGRPLPNVNTGDNQLADDSAPWSNGAWTPTNCNYTATLFGGIDDLRPWISTSATKGGHGYDELVKRSAHDRRQLQITGKTLYPSELAGDPNPTPTMTGGIGLRIPTAWGDAGALGERSANSVWANLDYFQWFSKGVMLSLWSSIDGTTGRHAYDYIRPKDSGGNQWVKGRNRPFMPTKRIGTMYSASPSLYDVTDLYTEAYTDANIDNSPEYGQHSDKYGLTEWGASPIYADIEIKAFIPKEKDRVTKIWFERGALIKKGYGQRAFTNHMSAHIEKGGAHAQNKGWGHQQINTQDYTGVVNGERIRFPVNPYTNPETWWWAWGGSDYLEDTDILNAIQAEGGDIPFRGIRSAWGLAADSIGSGGSSTTFNEGLHTLRFVFHEQGLTHIQDGVEQGTDPSSQGPVYGFTMEHAALHKVDTAITQNVYANIVNPTGKDPVIDTVTVREILTPQSMPCHVETVTYTFANIAKLHSLEMTGENMNANQFVRVSICSPGSTSGSWDGFGQAAGTPFADFESLDPIWAGGYGSINLVDLPSSALTSGFTLRFEFTIPSADDAAAMPIDWSTMPAVSSWEFVYDEVPAATLAVTGETFAGDITSPIDTRVGHIVSYRIGGSTPDADRLISKVKVDYGDGRTTEWLEVEVPAATIAYDISHSYTSTASGLSARAKVMDDNGNESDWSSITSVNVANAPPTAMLRATPSLVRAGDSVRLDGSKSFDIEEGGSVTNFTFNAGDGSTAIGPQSANYTTHTYASAGEFMATMTCEDATGASSNTAKAIIKVLPARLTVPLVLNTMPHSFTRLRSATYTVTTVLDADYPEMTDSGQRMDDFSLTGTFLTTTQEADIDFMEDLLSMGHLVEFEWQAVNYQGTPDSRTFVGRVTSFSYSRAGGEHGQTPWTATLIREAGVGQ